LIAIVNTQPISPGTLGVQSVDPKVFTDSDAPLAPFELPAAQLNELLELKQLLQAK
jgi:hypothetical protein